MQAIIGCCIEGKKGEWFVQLRTAAENVMDQVILSTCFAKGREAAIEKARKFAGVDEIIPWPKARMTTRGVVYPHKHGVSAALTRCGQAIDLLCFEINKHHNEI